MTQRKRLEAAVHGRVQGVGFRWFVRSTAARLKLVGWVANDPSGSVRVVVEGDDGAVDELAAELRTGPSGAIVDRVDTAFAPPTGEFASFTIRPGGHSGD
jgi:acylphosphatase